jgi:RNA polymerase-binding transcription factor DksA
MRLNARLLAELGIHREDLGEIEAHQSADRTEEESDRNILYAELKMETCALQEVEDAIERIKNGTYGICMKTGLPISSDRLRAIPWTRYCREAVQRGR